MYIDRNGAVEEALLTGRQQKVYNQAFSRKLPQSIQSVALRKLIMIDNAGYLEDLRVPPANRLEKLDGNRKGQTSIRTNDQYRICFRIEGNNFLMWRLSIITDRIVGKEETS